MSSACLLFVSNQHVARADATGAKVGTRHADLPAEAVIQALQLEGGKPRQVFVLLDEVFTQTISLNVSQTAGLAPLEVERALAFEVEPLSGIAPFDSALGFRALDVQNGQRRFAIGQMHAGVRDEIQKLLLQQGVKLAGICHPRGLSEKPVPSDDAGLQAWLAEAAKALATTAPTCAMIGPTELPTPATSYVLVGAAVFGAVAALCFFHWSTANSERLALKEQQAQAQKPQEALNAVRGRATALKKELKALQDSNAKNSDSRSLLDHEVGRQRGALSLLVEQLSKSQPEDAAIDVIETNGDGVTVRGISLDSKQADEWVARLSAALKPAGWRVQAIDKTALRRLNNGGPYAFTLQAVRTERSKAPAPAVGEAL